jgi:Predicted 3'-5' exonuclease related to the exonuclease domain of PolB
MSYPRSVFQGKATLHELCRVMGLPGKPDGVSGGEVEKYYRDGVAVLSDVMRQRLTAF